MKTYLTKKLNLEEHVKQYPPTNIINFQIDKLKLLLGFLTEIPARSERFDSNTGMVPLNAEKLKKWIWDYKPYLDYALDTGILVSDNHYIIGKKSKGYRFSNKYMERAESIPIVNYTLVKKHQKEKEIDPTVKKKYSYLTKWFNDDLHIDHTGAIEYLESTMTGNENIYRYNYNLCRINKFEDQEFYMSIDGTVQRFHSNLTSLPEKLREFITYAGEDLVSIDITNSQPYLSIALFNPSFYDNSNSTIPLTLFTIYSCSLLELSAQFFPPPMLQEILQETENQDVKHYVDLVTNGLIYEYLAEEIKDELGIECKTRKEIKEVIFTVLFTGNQFIGQHEAGPKRVFKDRFPTVYKIFSLIKKEDKTNLPKLLQRIESYIILDRVCKKIAEERPYLPIFTIHDSVITTVGNEGYIEAIMREELTLCIGYKPSLKIEYWRNHD